MNRRLIALGLCTAALLSAGSLSIAADQKDPPMHMHKSQMNHDRPDAEVAKEYKTEAATLREKAESHRKLAKLYAGRTAPKGGASYANVAKHCEKLAQTYENAAKAAEAVSTELSK